MSRRQQLALGLLLGVAADAVLADPRRGHPVAGFGSVAGRVEHVLYRDSRAAGAGYAAAAVVPVIAVAAAADRASGRCRWALIAAGTWTVLGGRSLRAEAHALHALLADADLEGARQRVRHLVGRDPRAMDAAEIARAAVESVAENTCDAIVAPLFWGAVAGLPGLLGYRAINTLDAMVGSRSPRYARFGWAAARLDDAVNLLPARLSAALIALVAPTVGGDCVAVLRTVARDGSAHPSPNSGQSEAAYAGALGLRLGGRNVYAGRVEQRPYLGSGRPPQAQDLPRAARLCAAATGAAAGAAALLAGGLTRRGRLLL